MRINNISSVSTILMSMTSKRNLSSSQQSGLMMILSPAKTLNLDPIQTAESDIIGTTEPLCDVGKTNELAGILMKKSIKDLKSLLKISDNLASSVFMYYESFELDSTKRKKDERIPASFAFDGPAYKGLDIKSCSHPTLQYLQSNLRIIDPLYGSLRPMDLIQPYRLEMATKDIIKDISKDSISGHKSLASWWSESITHSIANELNEKQNGKYLINLASDEYSSAIDKSLLPNGTQYIKVVFQQEGKVIAVHAKRARGLMVRYISDHQISNLDDVKKFDLEGYSFVEKRSDECTFTFDRSKQDMGNKESSRKNEDDNKKKRKANVSTSTKRSSRQR